MVVKEVTHETDGNDPRDPGSGRDGWPQPAADVGSLLGRAPRPGPGGGRTERRAEAAGRDSADAAAWESRSPNAARQGVLRPLQEPGAQLRLPRQMRIRHQGQAGGYRRRRRQLPGELLQEALPLRRRLRVVNYDRPGWFEFGGTRVNLIFY